MLKTGKLDSRLLEEIVFKNIKFKRPEVITRPGIGEDCAVVDFGAYECVMSTDPITAAVGEIGDWQCIFPATISRPTASNPLGSCWPSCCRLERRKNRWKRL